MKPIKKFFRALLGFDNSSKLSAEEKLPKTENPTPLTSQPLASATSPFFRGDRNDVLSDLGLQTAMEYYNQKYPERGEIHCIYEELQMIDFDSDVTQQLVELRASESAKGNHEPIKIILTTFTLDPISLQREPYHSHPFILTQDKLISLRTPYDPPMELHREMAESIEVRLVESAKSHKSIQADFKSCHFIALGILKDLTKEDLEEISTFKNGLKPLAKSLKYSQSGGYIDDMLTTENMSKEVKKGLTATEYREKYRIGLDTRIAQKEEKFRNRLASLNNDPFASPKLTASELLQKGKPEKEH